MNPLFKGYDPANRVPLCIMASGSGTLMEAAFDSGFELAEPRLVITDRPCRAQKVAEAAGVPCIMFERTDFSPTFNRGAYTWPIIRLLQDRGIGLVAMMGFETVLDEAMFRPETFGLRVLNSHPALLPMFKGAHAVRDAFAAGVWMSGTSIHVATRHVDDEDLVLVKLPVMRQPDDTMKSWHERIKVVERQWYPLVIDAYIRGEFGFTPGPIYPN